MDRLIFHSTSAEAFGAQVHQHDLLREAAAQRLAAGTGRASAGRQGVARFVAGVRVALSRLADAKAALPVSRGEGA